MYVPGYTILVLRYLFSNRETTQGAQGTQRMYGGSVFAYNHYFEYVVSYLLCEGGPFGNKFIYLQRPHHVAVSACM